MFSSSFLITTTAVWSCIVFTDIRPFPSPAWQPVWLWRFWMSSHNNIRSLLIVSLTSQKSEKMLLLLRHLAVVMYFRFSTNYRELQKAFHELDPTWSAHQLHHILHFILAQSQSPLMFQFVMFSRQERRSSSVKISLRGENHRW